MRPILIGEALVALPGACLQEITRDKVARAQSEFASSRGAKPSPTAKTRSSSSYNKPLSRRYQMAMFGLFSFASFGQIKSSGASLSPRTVLLPCRAPGYRPAKPRGAYAVGFPVLSLSRAASPRVGLRLLACLVIRAVNRATFLASVQTRARTRRA